MTYDAAYFFINLIIISVIMLPIQRVCRTEAGKTRVSIVTGLWILFILSPGMLLFWPMYWFVIWGLVRIVVPAEDDKESSTLPLFVAIALALLPMLLWKLYPDWFEVAVPRSIDTLVQTVTPFFADLERSGSVGVPIGLSFTAFRAADLLICVHLGLVEKPRLRELMHYGLFAPVLFVGPIIQYSELKRVPSAAPCTHIIEGGLRTALGFAKLFFLAMPLAPHQASVAGFTPDSGVPQGSLLWSTILLSWYFYLNFSAYSDIAIGISKIWGYTIRENFNFPYFKPNLQQFWANWHMSLTSFAQRNVFVPLGGFRREKQSLATFATMMVIALWHDISLNMLVYGILHGTVLALLRRRASRSAGSPSNNPARNWFGAFLTYSFVTLTLPLLILDVNVTPAFYARLFLGAIL